METKKSLSPIERCIALTQLLTRLNVALENLPIYEEFEDIGFPLDGKEIDRMRIRLLTVRERLNNSRNKARFH